MMPLRHQRSGGLGIFYRLWRQTYVAALNGVHRDEHQKLLQHVVEHAPPRGFGRDWTLPSLVQFCCSRRFSPSVLTV